MKASIFWPYKLWPMHVIATGVHAVTRKIEYCVYSAQFSLKHNYSLYSSGMKNRGV